MKLVESQEMNVLDKEIIVSMPIKELAIIYAMLGQSSDDGVNEMINESLYLPKRLKPILSAINKTPLYDATKEILTKEGVIHD